MALYKLDPKILEYKNPKCKKCHGLGVVGRRISGKNPGLIACSCVMKGHSKAQEAAKQ